VNNIKAILTQAIVIRGKDGLKEYLKVAGYFRDGSVFSGILPKPDRIPTVTETDTEFDDNAMHEVEFSPDYTGKARLVAVRDSVQ